MTLGKRVYWVEANWLGGYSKEGNLDMKYDDRLLLEFKVFLR